MNFQLFKKKETKTGSGNDELSAEEQEVINEEKQDMIQGIEDLSETTVKEVMVPRIDVDFISVDTPPDELIEKIVQSGHSRFPVYSESIDNVVGVLYVKDLIYCFGRKSPIELQNIIRKAFFVPESKRIDTLLREFKRRHCHIAIAIDEYGGIAGIITMEDIIEEIVGDIQDESDEPEAPEVLPLPDGSYDLDGEMTLDDVSELLSLTFETGFDEDTLGGYIFGRLGRKPEEGDEICRKNWRFTVLKMDQFRIERVKAEKMKKRADI